MIAPAHRIAVVLALAALAVVGRLSLLAIPNVSLSYLVVFLAGVAFGVRVGASVGLLSRLAADLILSGLNPIFIPLALVEALLGGLAGLLHRTVNLGQHGPAPAFLTRSLLLALAIVYSLLFSFLADTADWLFFNLFLTSAPGATRGALYGTLIVKGLVFMVPAVFVNAALFPALVPPILHTLRNAGLLPERAATGPAPERVVARVPAIAEGED